MLALRLLGALPWRLMEDGLEEDAVVEDLERRLVDLERAGGAEVLLGRQARTWELNISSRVKLGLNRLKLSGLLKDTTVVPSSPPL